MRERGLKCLRTGLEGREPEVAPRAGAWIEIYKINVKSMTAGVAPRAGAWIEIRTAPCQGCSCAVAPRAGAWIEILRMKIILGRT